MRVIFPYNPISAKEADEPFSEEYECLKSLGVECSLFDYDSIQFGEFRPKPGIVEGEEILYRGWMMNPNLYEKFIGLVENKGGKVLTSLGEFVSSHHLPNWYESCKNFTAESYFYKEGEAIEEHASKLGWNSFFVKDYVKSNYGNRGSIAKSPSEVLEIVTLIKEHRGEIEGGICLRKVEEYLPKSEVRYFVFNGKPYSPSGKVPKIVAEISRIHKAPFYSVDLIQRVDGGFRLVELGDGQVSDRKSWNAEVFCKMILDNA